MNVKFTARNHREGPRDPGSIARLPLLGATHIRDPIQQENVVFRACGGTPRLCRRCFDNENQTNLKKKPAQSDERELSP